MKPLVIQFSGGRTSAFMTKFLFEHFPTREKHVLFENTGREHENTLKFVLECDRRWDLRVQWLEAVVHKGERKASTHRIVDFESADRTGKPFEDVLAKYGLVNLTYKHCTRELKINVLNSYLNSIGLKSGDYETAIGIRADEMHRINRQTAERENLIYPLVDIIRVNKKMILDWWARQDFDLELRDGWGNCDFCFKKSINKLANNIRENPSAFEWWAEMERKYSLTGAGIIDNEPRKLYRGNRTAEDLREIASVPTLFDNPEFEIETDCFCKST